MIFSKCSNVDEALKLFQKVPDPTLLCAFFFADKAKAARIENLKEDYDVTIIIK
jgi:hypothetical protein